MRCLDENIKYINNEGSVKRRRKLAAALGYYELALSSFADGCKYPLRTSDLLTFLCGTLYEYISQKLLTTKFLPQYLVLH